MPLSFSRLSRTNGKRRHAADHPSIDALTAFDHASVCFRSGSPVSATAFSSAGLPSFVSRLIQSRSDCGNVDLHAAGLAPRAAC